jgi:formate dehydrogenase major subunit
MSEAGHTVTLIIDGRPVTVPREATLFEAAREAGIAIPVLCHAPHLRPVGVCRLCVVDVGERVLAAACVRRCEEGMTVQSATPEVQAHRRMLVTLLLADYPEDSRRQGSTGDDALLALAKELGIEQIPFPAARETGRGEDLSSPVIAVDHRACILCDRCIRACDEVQHNDVIGRTGKGFLARIAFDLDDPMGKSSCVSCGECMAACPTGALTNKSVAGLRLRFGADRG